MPHSRLQRLVEQGRAFEQQNRYEDALAVYEKVLHVLPTDQKAAERKAFCLVRLLRNDEALLALDQALTLDRESYWLISLRAKTLWRLKRYSEADEAIDRALVMAPNYVYALLTKYYIARDLKVNDVSLHYVARATELEPENADAQEQHAAALYRLKRYEEALPRYERAEELAPDNSSPVYWRGCALWELRRTEEAVAAFEQTVDLNPGFANGWRELAGALAQLGRTDDALAACERAVELKDSWDAWRLKARILNKLGRLDGAVTAFEAAIVRKPDDSQPVEELVGVLSGLKRHEEALATLDLALSRFPRDERLWSSKGFALHTLGRIEEAIVAWKRAIEIDPDNAVVLKNLVIAYEQQKRYGDMLLPINRLLAHDARDSYALMERIRALYALGLFEEARTASVEALRLLPENKDIKTQAEFVERSVQRPGVDGHITLRDGRRMEYVEYGAPDGYPILCCHGTPGSRLEFWPEDTIAKAMGARLIVPDRPGYGLSDPKRRQTILGWADDAEELADSLGLEHFAVLGISGGGAYAAVCAFKLSARIAGLALISSAAPIARRAIWRDLHWQQRVAALATLAIPRPLDKAIHNMGARTTRRDPGFRLRMLERVFGDGKTAKQPRIYTPVELEVVAEPYRLSGLGHTWDSRLITRPWGFDLKGITAPTFVWHGEADRIAPLAEGQFLVRNIPNCHATYYPNEGHSLFYQHCREILGALLRSERGVGGEATAAVQVEASEG